MPANDNFAVGREYFRTGDDERAIAALEKHLQVKNRDLNGWELLAKALMRQKKFAEAKIALRHAYECATDEIRKKQLLQFFEECNALEEGRTPGQKTFSPYAWLKAQQVFEAAQEAGESYFDVIPEGGSGEIRHIPAGNKCPVCGEMITHSISQEDLAKITRFPFSHAVLHGNPLHVAVVYIDADCRVRGVEAVGSVEIAKGSETIQEVLRKWGR
ncbi:MAG TPA: hypothetical protein VKK79_24415 [Candidatus Lokiarchaeia archaeon]|nr:hypothetical protein [Candidatus Lokiarchaeia archaeon]